MSDVRNLETLQSEYGKLTFQAGQLQYQIVTFQKDLDLVNEQIRDLNFEAAALKAKEPAAEAPKAEEVKANV